LERARSCDLVVKCSGVGRYDEYLDRAVLTARTGVNRVLYWDVDAPFTLETASREPDWYFRKLIPRYDAIATYGGGPRVERGYRAFGAAEVELVYNAVDPRTHYPVQPDPGYECDMLLVANRLPDREARIWRFFLDVAARCPSHSFNLGGEGWHDVPLPGNVRYLGHVGTGLHNRLNCSARLVLNVNRQAMADFGYSPPTRVFEAAGAGACLVSDLWDGIDLFLQPGTEVLMAESTQGVAGHVVTIGREEAAEIGARARERVLSEHTYRHRGAQLEGFLARLLHRPA
jgi:spore maturation protein CgeB